MSDAKRKARKKHLTIKKKKTVEEKLKEIQENFLEQWPKWKIKEEDLKKKRRSV